MLELKVRKFGNSLGVILPKELIQRLHTAEGEHILAIRSMDDYDNQTVSKVAAN